MGTAGPSLLPDCGGGERRHAQGMQCKSVMLESAKCDSAKFRSEKVEECKLRVQSKFTAEIDEVIVKSLLDQVLLAGVACTSI